MYPYDSNPEIRSANLVKDSSISTVDAVEELKEIMKPITEGEIPTRRLEKEFNLLNKLTTGNDNAERLIQHKQFQSLNRYSDILPYQETVVRIVDEEELTTKNYINANFISNPFHEGDVRNFIATQGPLQHTAPQFWRMIEVFKVLTIVSIVEHASLGNRCYQYWPSSLPLDIEHYRVNVKQRYENELYHFKTLEVTNKATDKIFEVNHFHIFGWVDHSVLSLDELGDYMELLIKVRKDMDNKAVGPTVVHCSAGIGRTGAFVASYYLYNHWLKCREQHRPFTFSIFALVRNLREQRFGFVQTVSQYRFLYQLINYFKV